MNSGCPVHEAMDQGPSAMPSMHQQVPLPTLTSLIRLVPLFLLFFLTTPHGIAEHIHSLYVRRPYVKSSPRDTFPSQRGDVDLSVVPLAAGVPSARSGIQLQPGTSLYASLRAPAACTATHPCVALIEAWYDDNLPRELRPDPYLLAANGATPQPFPRYPASRLADDEAFFTWRSYHFLQLPTVTKQDDWRLRVLNHDSTVFNPLNATLRVTISTNPIAGHDNSSLDTIQPLPCPRGPVLESTPCSNRGKCVRGGVCQCNAGTGGRYCESNVTDIPRGAFEVAPDAMRIFRFVSPHHAHIVTELHLLPPQAVSAAAHPILFAKKPGQNGGRRLPVGPPLPTIYDAAFTDSTAVRAHLATQRIVTRDVKKDESIYVAVYNFRAAYPAWLVRRHPKLRTSALLAPRRAVRVSLTAYPCAYPTTRQQQLAAKRGASVDANMNRDAMQLPPCPSHPGDWELSVRVLAGPLLLGSLTLLTMVVCVSVWAGIFRQHVLEHGLIGGTGNGDSGFSFLTVTNGTAGGVNGALNDTFATLTPRSHTYKDKLSEAEVSAMFPAFRFVKRDTAALCAVGDASCSVCLCVFEEGDELRRLACGHSYHASCLDRWLVTNATCPRCRMAARIRSDTPRVSALRTTLHTTLQAIVGVATWFRGAARFTMSNIADRNERNSSVVDANDESRFAELPLRHPYNAATV